MSNDLDVPLFSVLQRIAQQVQQNLLKSAFIIDDLDLGLFEVVKFTDDLNVLEFRLFLFQLNYLLYGLLQNECARLDSEFVLVDHGVVEYVVDQEAEQIAVLDCCLDFLFYHLLIGFVETGLEVS